MTWDEYQKTRSFMEEKALALMKHEKKDMVKSGLPIDNYNRYIIGNRSFYSMKANVFKHIIGSHWIRAQQEFPEKFGTGHAMDVVEAIHAIEPTFDLPRFAEFLVNEQFAYVIEIKDGEVIPKVLRIDLFRELKKDKNGNLEFVGGIMHAAKHFSVNDVNLATGNDKHNISDPEEIIRLAVEAFFVANGMVEPPNKLVSRVSIDDKYDLKFVFYHETVTDVHFIKTIHKDPKP